MPQLLKTAVELHEAAGGPQDRGAKGKADGSSSGAKVPTLTTGSIAGKIGAKSGSDLLLAAAGHLALVRKTDQFSRQQLLAEMRSATAYYKKTYANNLSKYLTSALKDGPLSEISTDSFALTASGRAELEKKLVDQ